MMNTELDNYNPISVSDIQAYAQKVLVPENSNTLFYLSKELHPDA